MNYKSVFSMVAALVVSMVLVAGNASAEYQTLNGLVDPYGMPTFDAGFPNPPDDGPAYYIWANNESLTDWTIIWAGTGTSTFDNFNGTITFGNKEGDLIIAGNTVADVETLLFEDHGDDHDSTKPTIGGVPMSAVVGNGNWSGVEEVVFEGKANTHYDGYNISLTEWTNTSFISFDLFISGYPFGSIADKIYFGKDMVSLYSINGGDMTDNDFMFHATPEPGTMILLGLGLFGVAYVGRKRASN